MDRQITFAGQIPLETDLLNTNKSAMVAIGQILQDMIGTSTLFSGLGCVPTVPAGMTVNVNPGRAYSYQAIDSGAYSSLAADSRQIVKQGILLSTSNFSCPAPVTAGYSINYLVQAQFQEVDTGSVVLPYYNASNPSSAYNGPNGSGASQATVRSNTVALSLKTGVAATTGSQITPTPDAGYTGLWVITVPYGASSITSGNISQYSGAPFLQSSLLSMIQNAPNGLIGNMSNARMMLTTAATSATFTADEIILGTALGGQVAKLASVSKTINLATVGVGGMDAGSAPVSGVVAIYAIYNPSTGASALLATNATSAAASTVYSGANMPAGYTFSALVSVWRTTSGGALAVGFQAGNKVYITAFQALSTTTTQSTATSFSVSAIVPPNAKTVQGTCAAGATAATQISAQILCNPLFGGQNATVGASSVSSISNQFDVALSVAQTLYYTFTITGGSAPTLSVYIASYTF